MRPILQALSWIALAATILPAVLYLTGAMLLAPAKVWMLAGTVVWFATVPLWMGD